MPVCHPEASPVVSAKLKQGEVCLLQEKGREELKLSSKDMIADHCIT